jgi:hypothetical protein
LAAQTWPDETFQAYGEKGERLYAEDLACLKCFIRFRARRGWGEFDSSCYFSAVWECLLALHDHCADTELRHLAEQMLNLRLAAQIVVSLNGMTVGAQGRIYAAHALDHGRESTYPVFYLYFDNVPQTFMTSAGAIDSLVSKFKPHALLTSLALHRKDSYEHRERIHLHNTADVLPQNPTPGSIRKYTYWTADYALGCVQFQDPYPKSCAGAWYAHHEQHQWDLSFPTHPQARLFTHHPGKIGFEHGYWTGDLGCGCGHFFQNRTALTALYEIPSNQPLDFIHAFVPRNAFDEVVEEHGWIFVRAGIACAALKLLNGHEWVAASEVDDQASSDAFVPINSEVRSPGRKNAVVCEVGRTNDFGGFDLFRREITGNDLSFDPAQMRLRYVSRRSGTLAMDTHGTRLLNEKPAALDYPLFDCPYLKSAWDEGCAELHWNDQILSFDFRETRPTPAIERE